MNGPLVELNPVPDEKTQVHHRHRCLLRCPVDERLSDDETLGIDERFDVDQPHPVEEADFEGK